ncbi:MAG: carbohydrate ABC transporter permease [Christensenellales bacterium]|jgi:multiple sugar transport system permease protein
MDARRISQRTRKEWLAAYLMSAPVVIGILVFYFVPTLWTVYMSLTEGPDYLTYNFVGFKNYTILWEELLQGKEFYCEVKNTFYYAFVSVILSMFFSVVFANLLNQKIRFRSLFRLIYFLPCLTMASAVGVVWRFLLNSKFGLINILLGFLGINGPMWLSDPNFTIPSAIIVGVWSTVGYNMILLLAGLQNIPKTYYEAAEIDGANAIQRFFRITIPLLSPVLFFVMLTSVMSGFKMFDLIYTLSNAAGAKSSIMLYYRTMVYGVYERGFLYTKFGVASAEAVILLAIILVMTLIQMKAQKHWVHYD